MLNESGGMSVHKFCFQEIFIPLVLINVDINVQYSTTT